MSELRRSELEQLIESMAQDGLVCPEPRAWDELWRTMKAVGKAAPPAPLILSAWGQTTDEQKRRRFVEQLAVVEQAGAAPLLIGRVASVPPSDWHRAAQTAASPASQFVNGGSPTEIEPGLVSAYLQTDFVLAGETELAFNVGRASPALDVAMIWRSCDRAAFLTAYNPFSRDVGDEINLKTQAALLSNLERVGLDWIAGEGRDPAGEWPGEPSVFVLDLTRKQAVDLGQTYHQNALVWCEVGQRPELVLLR